MNNKDCIKDTTPKIIRIRQILTIGILAIVLFGVPLVHILLPDETISYSERRKLAQYPEFTTAGLLDGSLSDDFEEYLLDQFPLREGFRTLKAVIQFYGFWQMDNNGIYIVDGVVCKKEYPLDTKQVTYAANKLQEVIDTYCTGMECYYSIIPDKNYFLAEENGYPHIDYDELNAIMQEYLTGAEYIDIYGTLDANSYYKTDTHWKQEKLEPVVQKLLAGMGMSEYMYPFDKYSQHTLHGFTGVYYGQSALPIAAEDIIYLTTDNIDNLTVYSVESKDPLSVYTLEKFEGMDGYDIYLSGAAALLEIENPNAMSDRELIIFRDSFGSSITPLMLETYSKITMIDIRYFSSKLLGSYVEFDDQQVLFLYSTLLLNSGRLLN